ncbi:hypothetical protein [Auritidibacter ignavus]|uniref:hypothetical protein n=1 Tax=Auritidibacter ignavus TaxID=678932 RepID=UPI0024476046|nr:hypothetical protein [Auritidibacter ignavus]WGH82957.1 hypothetical protein QDX20_06580 [Auritidibacter ignavus]
MVFHVPSISSCPRAVALTVGVSFTALAVAGCGGEGDDPGGQGEHPADAIPSDQVPTPSEASITLADQVEQIIDDSEVYTGEEIWGDRWLVADSLREVEDPDLCQQATTTQLEATMNSTDPSVYALMEEGSRLDDATSTEDLDVVEFSDEQDLEQRVDLEATQETECQDEEITEIDEDTVTIDAGEVSIRQVTVSDFLTARTAQLVADGTWIRYRSVYPSSTEAGEVQELSAWAESAGERLDELYTGTR